MAMPSNHSQPPVIEPGHNLESVTHQLTAFALSRRTPARWALAFALAALLAIMLLYAVVVLTVRGIGVWGVTIPIAWGFAIINFVWWIGIGHAGTLISAILLLFRQSWRTSINRFAEAMTLFAVACAAIFPLLHLGRMHRFYFILPYPNTFGLWPQWRSPLVWDVFAVATYGTVSLLFWYVGLIPDLATLRDRAQRPGLKYAYGFFAMGWRNSARHWRRYLTLYLLLAGLATPLVVSVHSIVSLDFAVSILPGWHTTIFPPYFVAGAIFSGFAMVLTLVIPLRAAFGFHDFITQRHLNNMAKIMLATGLIVAYGYLMENFSAWYSNNRYETFMTTNRMTGPYGPFFWLLMLCNVLIPQLLWFYRVRTTAWVLFGVALAVNYGMWLERYIIVVTSLHRDYLPSAWGMYAATRWDWMTLLGSMGLFLTLLFLFIRLLPSISIFEVRELVEHQPFEQRAPEEL